MGELDVLKVSCLFLPFETSGLHWLPFDKRFLWGDWLRRIRPNERRRMAIAHGRQPRFSFHVDTLTQVELQGVCHVAAVTDEHLGALTLVKRDG